MPSLDGERDLTENGRKAPEPEYDRGSIIEAGCSEPHNNLLMQTVTQPRA